MEGEKEMPDNIEVLILGCGYMGIEYCKVLRQFCKSPIVVGNSAAGTKRFYEEVGIEAIQGGICNAIKDFKHIPEYAIVAVPISELADCTELLLEVGVKHILVEKPAGINYEEVEKVVSKAEKNKANVYVAYNRRFYSSTKKVLEFIKQDGGLLSFSFEFTEWSSQIEKINNPKIEKENWLLANSTHVIDLAFFIGGNPVEMKSYAEGGLPWHPNGSIYSGAGKTDKEALFSYQANWDAPGRWALEFMTRKHRLYLKPMEKLQIQELNSIAINEVELDDEMDILFKPGIYEQVKAFLSNAEDERLLTISKHLENIKYYETIAGISASNIRGNKNG